MRKVSVLLLVLTLGAASPALADCCDSFWDCAAAYVTDGLSCVIQEIIATVKGLIDLMNNLTLRVSGNTQRASDEARQYVSETIAQTRADAQGSTTVLATALTDAQAVYKEETALVSVSAGIQNTAPKAGSQPASPSGAMVGHSMARPAKGAVPAAPPPPNASIAPRGNAAGVAVPVTQLLAPHGGLTGLFEKGIAEIQRLKTAGDKDLPTVMQLMTRAEQSEGPALQSALATADQVISAPIRNVVSFLNGMLTDPTSIYDPTDMVDQTADAVLANLDTNLQQMVNTITAGPEAAFGQAQGAHDELLANAQRAEQIAAAMRKAYADRTPASQSVLSQLLPLPNVTSTGQAYAIRSGGALPYAQMMVKFKSNKAAVVSAAHQRMQILVPALAQFKSVRNKALAARSAAAATKASFTQKLNATFANKTRAQIDSLRDQLIAQARTQLAGDPKTRDKVIALLTSETAKLKPAS